MQVKVLSIAGLDPSGGAGLIADIKTFQAFGVYGFAVTTAITVQNESTMKEIHWLDQELITAQIDIILKHHEISAVKIGVTQGAESLEEIVIHLRSRHKNLLIIWDPVFRSSGGFDFWKTVDEGELTYILDHIDLVTPNLQEYKRLWGNAPLQDKDYKANILLKSASESDEKIMDKLWWNNKVHNLCSDKFIGYDKHGTGCLLSSAITAGIASGFDPLSAWHKAKDLLRKYMFSSTSLLGQIPLNI